MFPRRNLDRSRLAAASGLQVGIHGLVMDPGSLGFLREIEHSQQLFSQVIPADAQDLVVAGGLNPHIRPVVKNAVLLPKLLLAFDFRKDPAFRGIRILPLFRLLQSMSPR